MTAPEILRAPRGNRICLEGFGIVLALSQLGIALIPWVAPSHLSPWGSVLFSLFWVMLAMLLLLFGAWHLSLRVELGDMQITRRSIFGTKSLRVSDIDTALFSSARGVTFLTVTSQMHPRWLMLSTYTFSEKQLHQIQDFLRNSPQAIRTSRPPLTTNQMINFSLVYLLLIFIVIAITVVGLAHRRSILHRMSAVSNAALALEAVFASDRPLISDLMHATPVSVWAVIPSRPGVATSCEAGSARYSAVAFAG
jgi:hypothetical protein